MTSIESPEQMEERLLRVIAKSQYDVLPDDYLWRPLRAEAPPAREAIACVRDDDSWHEFAPASDGVAGPRYRVVSFRFQEGISAAGFIAWLAGHLKRSAGTGCVVICGKDRRDTPALFEATQGVFDYYCCSVAAADRFLALIQSLIDRGKQLA